MFAEPSLSGVPSLDDLADPRDPRPSGLRVLIVEDNVDQAAMLAILVQRWGHSVIIANDSAEALKVFADFQPRVILLDLGLPDRHGYDLADALKDMPRNGRLHFVAVTGWNTVVDQIRSASSGIKHHLMKPPNLDVLREILSAYASSE